MRYGTSFSYAIPAANGTYTVNFKFTEPTATGVGQRKFDVSLEGTLVLDDLDIYSAAGGSLKALDRSFNTTVSDGKLNIAFTGVVGNALVSTIEVLYTGSGPTTADASYTYRGDGLTLSGDHE
jgi:beta-galactosidase